jgi:hypothetical protein
MVRLFDDALDVCNALALGLKLFLLYGNVPRSDWPQEVLLQELQAASASPWWTIEACLPSHSAKGSQLNIHVNVSTRDYSKVQYSSVQTAAIAQRLAPGYSRYFISLRSPKALPGWAGFYGLRLSQVAAQSRVSLADYASALEDNLIFYVPHHKLPRAINVLDSIRVALQVQAQTAANAFWDSAGQCRVQVRHIERHCSRWLVTNAWVVIDKPDIAAVRKGAPGILTQVHAHKPSMLAVMPSGFTYVSVFAVDFRRRRLYGYGLGPALVCTLTKRRDSRKQIMDILGSRTETLHGIRFAWNTNWPGLGDHLSTD